MVDDAVSVLRHKATTRHAMLDNISCINSIMLPPRRCLDGVSARVCVFRCTRVYYGVYCRSWDDLRVTGTELVGWIVDGFFMPSISCLFHS